MAVASTPLILPKQAETVQTVQYQSPSSTVTVIDKFTATNTGASNATFSCNLVPSPQSPSASNLIVDDITIEPGKTYRGGDLVGQELVSLGSISTIATGTVTISSAGRVIS